MGMEEIRWFEADVGVRRSKMRRWESEETEERSDGECGEKAVLYVQLCVGRVVMDCWRRGDHYSVIVSIPFTFHSCFPTLENCRDRTYNLNRPIPTTTRKRILSHQVPIHTKHLSLMFLPTLYRKLWY